MKKCNANGHIFACINSTLTLKYHASRSDSVGTIPTLSLREDYTGDQPLKASCSAQ